MKCVSRYWKMRLRDEDGDRLGMRGLRGSLEGRKVGWFHQDMLSSLGMGTDSEEKLQLMVCYRAADNTEGLDWRNRGRGEDLHLAHLLF